MNLITKYDKFLNENLKKDFYIGQQVLVNGRLGLLNIENERGIVSEINEKTIKIEFINNFSPYLLYDETNKYTSYYYPIDRNIEIKPINEKFIEEKTLNILRLHNLYDIQLEKLNMVYIKYTDDVNFISYLPYDKIKSVDKNNVYNSNKRQRIKIGKFFKKLYPLKSEKEIEEYVNNYKIQYYREFDMYDIDFVDGEDIRKYYYCENYDGISGRLNSSCIKDEEYQERFDIFVENPDIVRMMIIRSFNNKEKIIGRTLIWKTNKGTYMDRPYTAYDYDIDFFNDYAKKNKWLYYENDDFEDEDLYVKIKKEKDYGDGEDVPYMDTFCIYQYKKNKLRTEEWAENNVLQKNIRILRDY